jgi:hypothetical protein
MARGGSSGDHDEARELRNRLDRIERDLARATGQTTAGAQTALCRTVQGANYPGAVGVWFLLQPIEITGTEAEGAQPAFADLPDAPFPALCTGANVPALGTRVIAMTTGNYWTF